MPLANLTLMLLIGLVFGGVAAVILRSDRATLVVNVLLGIVGAALGAFFPVLLGWESAVDTSGPEYLLRALLGAFLLVLLASLFRPARTRRMR